MKRCTNQNFYLRDDHFKSLLCKGKSNKTVNFKYGIFIYINPLGNKEDEIDEAFNKWTGLANSKSLKTKWFKHELDFTQQKKLISTIVEFLLHFI